MPPDPERASLFADLNPARHSIQRRKFASSYSMSSIVGYEQYVNNCTSLLSQRFSEIAASGHTVDMYHWLQCYAFDVIGEITFSNRFGFLDMGEDNDGVFDAIESKSAYSTFAGVFPWIHAWIFPHLPKTGGHAYVLNYTSKQIEARHQSLKDPKNLDREGPPDIMTKLLKAHEDNPTKTTRLDLFTMCQSNIGAGSDTTAITLSSIFYHLMTHPASYRRLQAEIDDAARTGLISDPVTFSQAQQLPYLQAVIKEGLRIHTAPGLPMPRIVPAEGTTIAGRFIPGGSTVGINAWVAHHNTNVYGADAASWRPERWLEIESAGRAAEVERYFFGFGMGSRTCIGKNISLLEMSKLVPQLFRKFDFVLDDNVPRDRLVGRNRWFVKQTGFMGRVQAREKSG
jgi:cytochrome P450